MAVLPLPLHVTLHHAYVQRRSACTVVGVSVRFRTKYTSLVLFKGVGAPLPAAAGAEAEEGARVEWTGR